MPLCLLILYLLLMVVLGEMLVDLELLEWMLRTMDFLHMDTRLGEMVAVDHLRLFSSLPPMTSVSAPERRIGLYLEGVLGEMMLVVMGELLEPHY